MPHRGAPHYSGSVVYSIGLRQCDATQPLKLSRSGTGKPIHRMQTAAELGWLHLGRKRRSRTPDDMFKHLVILSTAVIAALIGVAGVFAVAGQRAQAAASPAVAKAADGHYWAQATVNGRPMRLLVDTGASVVTLTAADAAQLGIEPAALTFDRKVRTGGGETRGASVTLAQVTVGDVRIEKVPAVVMQEGLSTSLLGMSYLGRLSRFEATPTALVLHP
jgi:aspartyl protease family protein